MNWLTSATTIFLSLESATCFVSNRSPGSMIPNSNVENNANSRMGIAHVNHRSAFDFVPKQQQVQQQPLGLLPAQQHIPTPARAQARASKRTSLFMGLGDMFRRKKKGGDSSSSQQEEQQLGDINKKDNDNPEDIKLALEAIKADLEAVSEDKAKSTSPKRKKDVSSVQLPNANAYAKAAMARKVANIVKPRAESERMNSSKTYGETVQDRINRVKSGQMTDEEKAQFLNNALTRVPQGQHGGPKIRQEIPDADGKKRAGVRSNTSLPKDALWNTVINNKNIDNRDDSPYKNTIRFNSKGERLDDSAKREYLDMVTNPDRFSQYAAMGGYKTKQEKAAAERAAAARDGSPGVVDNLQMLDPAEDPPDLELALRLETAAIMKEKEDARNKAQKAVEEKAKRQQAEALMRDREEKMQQRNSDKYATQQANEIKKKEVKKETLAAERKRLAELQAAQDTYWENKLKEENSKKSTFENKEETERSESEQKKRQVFEMAQVTKAQAEQAKIERLSQQGQGQVEKKEGTAPSPKEGANVVDAAANAFVDAQEKKKAALDQFMKEQKDRLATLSSPLPFQNASVPKVQPRKSNGASSSPPPATIPSLNLADLTMKKSAPSPFTPAPTPTPAPAAPRLSLAEMTMLKKPNNSAPAPSPAKAPASSSRPLSLAQMTMLKKPQGGAAAASKPAAPQTIGAAVRQNSDDEEEDFFEFSRGGGNSGMSLKEIMAQQEEEEGASEKSGANTAKEKSKMWGIDIDAQAKLCSAYSARIANFKLEFDVIFGPAYKGIGLAAGVAATLYTEYGLDYGYAYNRKEVKDHGEGGSLVGADVAGKRCLLIDDVISAGTAVREAKIILDAANGILAGVVVALDRQERSGKDGALSAMSAIQSIRAEFGVPVYGIVCLDDLLTYLDEQGGGHGLGEYTEAVRSYRERYGVDAAL